MDLPKTLDDIINDLTPYYVENTNPGRLKFEFHAFSDNINKRQDLAQSTNLDFVDLFEMWLIFNMWAWDDGGDNE